MENMCGFKVHLNNEFVCNAGFEKANSVVTCILDSIRREYDETEELNISVAGLNSDTNKQVRWYQNELKKGDKITIEVISDGFDQPEVKEEQVSKEKIIENKLKHFYRLKEELKDYLEK